MIELLVREYLKDTLGVPVYFTEPPKPPQMYLVIDKISSTDGAAHVLNSVILAVQSIHADSIGETMKLDDRVKKAMRELEKESRVTRCRCNSDSNFTDPETHRFRYQALFEITYYEEE